MHNFLIYAPATFTVQGEDHQHTKDSQTPTSNAYVDQTRNTGPDPGQLRYWIASWTRVGRLQFGQSDHFAF